MNNLTKKQNIPVFVYLEKGPKLVLTILMTVTLVLTSLMFVPESVYANVEIQDGTPKFDINKPDATKVRFGGKQWVTVGYNGTGIAASSNAITLLLDDGASYGNSAFMASGGSNEYSGSTLEGAMIGAYNSLTAKEKTLIKDRNLTGGGINCNGSSGYHPDLIAGPGIPAAKFWPLSAYEAGLLDKSISKLPQFWWLRSPGLNNLSAAHTILDGTVEKFGSNSNMSRAVRPAFNMDLSNVLFTSAASGAGSKSSAGIDKNLVGVIPASGPIKFTAMSPSLNLTCTDTSLRTVKTGDTVSIKYSGATTAAAANNFVSCVITNSQGTVLYYGKLSNAASGQASFKVPPLGSEIFSLKLFSEEINGDFFTDFCSKPITIPLAVNMQVAKPKLKKPSISKITVSKKKITVKWNKAAASQDVTKYQIKYREKGKAKWVSKTVKATKNKLVIKNLKKGKQYQVKIRTYRESTHSYSAWSKTKLSKAVN